MKRSDATVLYDAQHDRLVYIGQEADERYWDDHWLATLTDKAVKRADPFVVSWTKRYLAPGAGVLDAGCGIANTVWGLQQAGFNAWGADYASSTVQAVKRVAPELSIVEADVRSLPFLDQHFEGVWSLGVIEHFTEGYREILDEMWRVLKPGGFAFVTVPSISPLRRAKQRLSAYPPFKGDFANFYQFVLAPDRIVSSFQDLGWTYVSGTARGGFKGLKDEAGPLRPLLQSVYDAPNRPARVARALLNRVLAPVSFHTRLYIFQKQRPL